MNLKNTLHTQHKKILNKSSAISVYNGEGYASTQAKIILNNKLRFTPLVSVIIPVYNAAKYLSQCLESVINQSLKEIEIICVDDGSTDNSLQILKKYGKRDLRLTILSQKNLHAGVARNAGLSVARGEYIHFLDSDDWLDSCTYEKLYQIAHEQNTEIVKFKSYAFDDVKKEVINSYFTNMGAVPLELFDQKLSFKENWANLLHVSDAPWSGIYNRNFLKKNQILFDNLLCANDTSFFFRCLAKSKNIYLSSERFVYYRMNNDQSLVGIRPLNFDCQLKQYNLVAKIVKKCDPKVQKEIQKHLIDAIFFRYAKYMSNLALNSDIKNKIRKETSAFFKKISPDLINRKNAFYYHDLIKTNIALSIIVPVYNTAQYLESCLNSLINQSLKNIEIICINDGSDDDSLLILKTYQNKDCRIKIINNKKNSGAPGFVKNKGVKAAKGDYIGFVDSDDFVDTNFFEVLYNNALKYNAEMSASLKMVFVDDDVKTLRLLDCEGKPVLCSYEEKGLLMKVSGSNCNKIYRRKMLKEAQITCYEERNIAEDNYFSMTAMCKTNAIALTSETAYYYRKRSGSITSERRSQKDFKIFEVYQKIDAFVVKHFKNKEERRRCMLALEQRKIQDFKWFSQNCCLEDISAFNECLKLKYPKIYNQVFPQQIIVNLTSYPGRINTVNQAIKTLLNQTLKADKVILWLAPEQFPRLEQDLPAELLTLKNQGLTIEWYHDIKSYKKLIPALKIYPDAILVTADDDNLYSPRWLEKLYHNYLRYPQDIQCHRVTKFYYDGAFRTIAGGHNYYKNANYLNKLVGLGGVLYPPHCFYRDVLDENLIMRLAPTNDDQWFWLQAALNGVKVRVVDDPEIEAHYIDGTQADSLTKINDHGEKLFWKDFNNLLGYYKELKSILLYGKHNPWLEKTKAYVFFIYYFLALKVLKNKKTERQITKSTKIKDYNYYKNLLPSRYAEELCSWFNQTSDKKLNLKNPQGYNQKIQWLKLYDATPLKTLLSDKYCVRRWIKDKIGEKYLIPLLGVYNQFDDIDFNKLPNQFVIKANHGCGWNIIVKDKETLDLQSTKQKITEWLQTNFAYKVGLELQYKNIKPKIIIEKYIENKGGDLFDYKFWCFDGKVKYIQFLSERNLSGLKMLFYDTQWNKQPFVYGFPQNTNEIEKPDNLDFMINLAEKAAKGFSHVRVDFYRLDDGTIYFGEMTFTSASGRCKWNLPEWDDKFGQLIKLPKKSPIPVTFDDRVRSIKHFLATPYRWIVQNPSKKKVKKMAVNSILQQLISSRVDIKNMGGAQNDFIILHHTGVVNTPAWFSNSDGIGHVVENKAKKIILKLKATHPGEMVFTFRGVDKKHNNQRFAVYADYRSIKINGKEILILPAITWHDKSFQYKMAVKEGQILNIEILMNYHQYSLDELRNVILKLNPNSTYIAQNISGLTRRVYKKITSPESCLIKEINELPTITAKAFIPIGFNYKPAYWLKSFNLRRCSLPFDWMLDSSLETILTSCQKGIYSWFEAYYDDDCKRGTRFRHVKDLKSGMVAMHHFPVEKSVEDYMPQFKEIFNRRLQRLKHILLKKRVVGLVGCRQENLETLVAFMQTMAQLYPLTHLILINVRHDNFHNDIKHYKVSKLVEVYEIRTQDENQTNKLGLEWIGNENVWRNLCSKLVLKQKRRFNFWNIQRQNGRVKVQILGCKLTLSNHKKEILKKLDVLEQELNHQSAINEQHLCLLENKYQTALAEINSKFLNLIEFKSKIDECVNQHHEICETLKTFFSQHALSTTQLETNVIKELQNCGEIQKQVIINLGESLNNHLERMKEKFAQSMLSTLDGHQALVNRQFSQSSQHNALLAEQSTAQIMNGLTGIVSKQESLDQTILKFKDTLQSTYQELNFADLFHDSTRNCPWLRDKSFSLYGWAANYSFMYTLFRILENVNPEKILEMGMGQTSKMTTQYAAYKKSQAKLDIIENDESWINVYASQLVHRDNIHIHHCDLEFFQYQNVDNRKYKNLSNIIGDSRLNLIIVDGPWGANQSLPRSNIIDLIPQYLADNFIIIFDDAERQGEQSTIQKVKEKLTANNIEYGESSRSALKRQVILTAKGMEFVRFL